MAGFPRSIRKYLTFRPFFRDVLNHIAAFSMITEEDAHRIVEMGADPKRVQVNGNAKHDLLASQTDPAIETRIQKLLGLKPLQPVLVGGSTREGEEELLLSVYKRLSKEFPEMVLVIAPRHICEPPALKRLSDNRVWRFNSGPTWYDPGSSILHPSSSSTPLESFSGSTVWEQFFSAAPAWCPWAGKTP